MGKMKRTREAITYDELEPGTHKIRRNTVSLEKEDGTFDIYLHGNLIATLYFEGSVRIFSGGWTSRLTQQRINRLLNHLNYSVWTTNGEWDVYYCISSRDPHEKIPFKEGMLLSPRT